MKLRPLGNLVVVRAIVKEKTDGGIYLGASTFDKQPFRGEVIAKGPGSYLQSGELVPTPVEPGDIILFVDGLRCDNTDMDSDLYFTKAQDIFAVVEPDGEVN